MQTKSMTAKLVKCLQLCVVGFMVLGLVFGLPPARLVEAKGIAGEAGQPVPGSLVTLTTPLEAVLKPDGSLDLSAGFRGSLDPGGYRLVSGPGEAPRFAPLVPGDEYWELGFSSPGTNGFVFALTMDGNGSLYVGGQFTQSGGMVTNRVARWDGIVWSDLGGGMNERVFALALDGSGNLYAGGMFTNAGGVNANYIAMWDPLANGGLGAWNPLGSGTNGYVRALAVDGSGNLYAGGDFTSPYSYVARWNGSTWADMNGGVGGPVLALAVDGSNVYVGGNFASPANFVALWNGSGWSALGTGTNNIVRSLLWDGGNLYAGGDFTTAGGITVNRIARWNGVGWFSLGAGMLNGNVRALVRDGAGDLYAGGDFTNVGGASIYRVARWNGANWSPLGSGVDDTVYSLVVDGGGNLYAGGEFNDAGPLNVEQVARWDGSSWAALGKGMNAVVDALALNGNGMLYAAGDFTASGGVVTNRIARWEGTDWATIGSGTNDEIRAMVIDANGNIYIGGDFTTAGGVYVNRVARWDGSGWSSLGSGIGGGDVYTLAIDGSGGLYVGGDFTYAGGMPASRVAYWDGANWSPVGSGIDNNIVRTLVLDEDGNLYAGGNFTAIEGSPVYRIAYWDGIHWSPVGDGLNSTVGVLVVDDNGNLYAGGSFTATIGGQTLNRVAVWDGFNWTPFGSGFDNGTVYALLVENITNIYAGGTFLNAGGASVSRIAHWDGISWMSMGSGINNVVYALALTDHNDLYVGGNFTAAGEVASARVALWQNVPPTAMDDSESMDEDTVLSVPAPGVLGNDSDGNNDPIMAVLHDGPYYGDLLLNSDGSFVYTPTLNLNGVITFTYDAYDGGLTDTATVSITVIPVNDPPVAVSDTVTTDEDMVLSVAAPGVLGNDLDVDGDTLNAVLGIEPPLGALQLNLDGSFIYTPALNYNGLITFTYIASDGMFTDTATVSVTVTAINDPPFASGETYVTPEDILLSVVAPGVLGNDVDAEGDLLTATVGISPVHGALFLNLDGSFVYTPALNYNGPDSFSYIVSDGSLTDTATVSLTVTSVLDVPEATSDTYATVKNTPLSVAPPGILGNDFDGDGDPLTAVLDLAPAFGEVVLNADGSFTYTPTLDYEGTDTFVYHANDGQLDSNLAFVTIEVIDAPPVVDAGDDQTAEEGQEVSFSGDYYDPGKLFGLDAGFSFRWDFGDDNIVTGTLTPTHTYMDNGVFTVTLTVTDTEGSVGSDWLLVTVTNVAPALGPLTNLRVALDETAIFTGTFSDPGWLDAHSVVIEWDEGITETLELPASTREFVGSHAYAQTGVYTVSVTIRDDDGGEDMATFTVTVGPVEYRVLLPIIQN